MSLQSLQASLRFISDHSEAASRLWDTFGSLNAIYQTPRHQLLQVPGVSESIADYIVCHSDLFSKITEEPLKSNLTYLSSSDQVYDFLRFHIGFQPCEQFLAFFLDTRNGLIDWKVLFKGGPRSSLVCPGVLAREALLLNSTHVIVAHNHPSGSLCPSHEDESITRRLKNALQLVDIHLLDHLIITSNGFYSFHSKHPEIF